MAPDTLVWVPRVVEVVLLALTGGEGGVQLMAVVDKVQALLVVQVGIGWGGDRSQGVRDNSSQAFSRSLIGRSRPWQIG